MKVGIIGGTRFIGVHLVRALESRGANVVLLNRGLSRTPLPFSRQVERIFGDRRDPKALDRLLRRPLDAVFDLCGYVPSEVIPILSRRDRFGAYAFVSTSSVYCVPPPVPYDEMSPLRNEPGTYGGDKRLAEELVLASSSRSRPNVVVRPQAVTGPWGAEQALYALKRTAVTAPVLLRPGTECSLLCPLWVGDLVNALLKAIDEPRAAGLALDIAGPDAVDPRTYVEAAARVCGGRAATKVLSLEQQRAAPWLGLPWLDHHLVAKGSLAREVLGLEPRHLEDTLAATWAWAASDARAKPFAPARGESEVLADRRISTWRRASWRVSDAARTSLLAARRALRSRLLLRRWLH